jgi:parallel beta-helix repeat protein
MYAQGTPTVIYNPGNNIITIGSAAGAEPGSQVISLPDVAAALTAAGSPDILVNQGGTVWLSKARIVVQTTGRLEITSAGGVSELRLESIFGKTVFIQATSGSQLLFDGVKVHSWDTGSNKVDENIVDGRAYIVAQEGATMTILRSEFSYLGDALVGATSSGVAWIKRSNPLDPTTGSKGEVHDSQFHHNYQGLFISEGHQLTISGNHVHNNLNQGILVRDGVQLTSIISNTVNDNGNKAASTGDGIVLFNNATQNVVERNRVFANACHGILLDNGAHSNTIKNNNSYQNSDGIALSDSDNNVVEGNTTRNNRNGIRISGAIDNPATGNQIISNVVEDSVSSVGNAYGIYLYNHADNNLLRNNTVRRSATFGIYLKSGANRLEGNVVSEGKTGIAIVGEAESIGQIPLIAPAGSNNVVLSSTISANTDIGIRIEGGVSNSIGIDPSNSARAGNLIESNGGAGILMKSTSAPFGSTNNQIIGNTIRNNGSSGISISNPTTLRNRVSQNSITGNASSGIKVDGGAQEGILAPKINEIQADQLALGTAGPGQTVELYSDPGGEGGTYLGTATADGNGNWTFQLPTDQDRKRVTALAIDANGNTSPFSPSSGSTVDVLVTVTTDEQQQTLIQITGAGATTTLAKIQSLLGGGNAGLLQNDGSVWQLNASLKLETDVTLNLTPNDGVTELRLRSDANPVSNTINHAGFVYIRTHNGTININSIKVSSWDPVRNKFDDTIGDGRAYIIAKFAASLNINNAELSYLGSNADSESFGVTWRDATPLSAAGIARTSVTGAVTGSKFHHNFVGVHLMQAGDMTFTNNEFYENLSYGFLARDNSRDTVLEGNLAYNNISHGIMLARGCTRFTLRNNKAYTNGAGVAHGIVVSRGSAPTAPSVENLLEGNEAYGNRGYGINVEGSNNNTLRNNNLHNNQIGLNLEDGSSGNRVEGNTFRENTGSGLQTRLGSNTNVINNNISTANTVYGFYIRSDGNTLTGNQATSNTEIGINVKAENTTPIKNNELVSNTVSNNTTTGIDIRVAENTVVRRNRIASNGNYGLYLTDGAVGTTVTENIIHNNTAEGIRVNGATAFKNQWSQNSIYGNQGDNGGIYVTAGANNAVPRPKITEIKGRAVSGSVTLPNATIELFTDELTQGRYFLGSTVADAGGKFTVVITNNSFIAPGAVVVATDAQGNSSEFSDTFVVPDVTPDFPLFMPLVRK